MSHFAAEYGIFNIPTANGDQWQDRSGLRSTTPV
jgi:hypothetical protein